jgi:hypothetical protein
MQVLLDFCMNRMWDLILQIVLHLKTICRIKMLVPSDLEEQDVKKVGVGGIQLNFPGTSLILRDWKYSKGGKNPWNLCFLYSAEHVIVSPCTA